MVDSKQEIIGLAEQTGHDPDALDLDLLMDVSKYQLYDSFYAYVSDAVAQKGSLLEFHKSEDVLNVALPPSEWEEENPIIREFRNVLYQVPVFELETINGRVVVDRSGCELDLINVRSDDNPYYSVKNSLVFVDSASLNTSSLTERKIVIVLEDSTQISFKILDNNIYERLDDNDITPHEFSGHVNEIINGIVETSSDPSGYVQLQCRYSDVFMEFMDRDDYSDIENGKPVIIAKWNDTNKKVYVHREDVPAIAYVKQHFHDVDDYTLV